MPHDRQVDQVVGDLLEASPALAEWWARHDVQAQTVETKHLHHATVAR